MSKACSIKRYLLSAVFLIFIFFLACNPALSQEATHSADTATAVHSAGTGEGEEGATEGDRSGDLLDLLYRFITFTLLVVILVIFVRKAKVMDFLSVRTDEIRKRLEDLKREKEEAEKKYRDVEGSLRDFESKKVEILEEYRREGIAERNRIIEEARVRVQQIIANSEAALEQEIRSLKNQLKRDIVETAIGQAKEIILKEIKEKDNDDLINEFVERVRKTN
jgi:F-type H+-transporting ATPase subunit b